MIWSLAIDLLAVIGACSLIAIFAAITFGVVIDIRNKHQIRRRRNENLTATRRRQWPGS